jgi:hypothetical protein
LNTESQAAVEEATDEIARLDQACLSGPESGARALWFIAVAELTTRTPSTFQALAAVEGDAFHEPTLPRPVALWRDLLLTEERRVRAGALLSVARFDDLAPDIGTYPDEGRLEGIWREKGGTRSVLARAFDSAAWIRAADIADASAALVLCAGGRTDRVRFLPFASIPEALRNEATEAWRAGDHDPWASAAAMAAARRARTLRELLRPLADPDREWDALESLGRAAILARRGLVLLRTTFVTTMPALSEALSVSRPAAAGALERLVAAGLARELTGRARDRVYGYEAACVIADIALAS